MQTSAYVSGNGQQLCYFRKARITGPCITMESDNLYLVGYNDGCLEGNKHKNIGLTGHRSRRTKSVFWAQNRARRTKFLNRIGLEGQSH